MELGTRLAAWRKHRGLKQRHVADVADVGVTTVSMWENGHAAPKHAHLVAVVDLFGITMERFYGRLPKVRA